VLGPEKHTNGHETLLALQPLVFSMQTSSVRVLDDKDKPIARGTVVAEGGYCLTKASELAELKELRVMGTNGKPISARRVREERAWDLLLIQADLSDARPVTWVASNKLEAGHWVLSASSGEKVEGAELKLGVLSAQTRAYSSRGAGLGVRMAKQIEPDISGEVRIEDVAQDGPAKSAGLRKGDVLLEVNGESVTKNRHVQGALMSCSPGQEIELLYRRGKAQQRVKLRLASLNQLNRNFDGEDYGNGGVSIRTDGFPKVLQHASPLTPADMGGPLMDLDGCALGINIARADRVATFALPMEVFWSAAQDWVRKDRDQAAK
jgi:serine protease Do